MTKADDGKTVTIAMTSTYGSGSNAFNVSLSFIVCADGTIMVNSLIRPQNVGAIIPKLGFRLEMPKEMEQLSWFGRGPWDSYRDRKEACLPAIYRVPSPTSTRNTSCRRSTARSRRCAGWADQQRRPRPALRRSRPDGRLRRPLPARE